MNDIKFVPMLVDELYGIGLMELIWIIGLWFCVNAYHMKSSSGVAN